MKRRHYLLAVALSLFAALAGHALYGALPGTRTAEARAADGSRDVAWEHCAVVKAQVPGSVRVVYWIVNFRGEGVKVEQVEAGLSGDSFGKAVARLGDDGWEMVGAGPLEAPLNPRPGPPVGAPTAIFFKRHKD